MDVDESTAKHTTHYNDKNYSFCIPGCKKAFEADPQQYLDPGHTASMGEHTHGTQCPVPEIRTRIP